jgi:hypothetical protein
MHLDNLHSPRGTLFIKTSILGVRPMLWMVAVIFFILWILGLASAFAIGGWIWVIFAVWILALIGQMASRNRRSAPPRAI